MDFAWTASFVCLFVFNLGYFIFFFYSSVFDSLRSQKHVFSRMQLAGVRVLPIEVLAHCFGGELGLADVAEVARQVNRFS